MSFLFSLIPKALILTLSGIAYIIQILARAYEE